MEPALDQNIGECLGVGSSIKAWLSDLDLIKTSKQSMATSFQLRKLPLRQLRVMRNVSGFLSQYENRMARGLAFLDLFPIRHGWITV